MKSAPTYPVTKSKPTTVGQGVAMSQLTLAIASLAVVVLGAGTGAAPRAPAAETAQDILARSVKAHGGAKLTSWKTMVVEGTIDMQDGITYHAAYRLWARVPGRLRVEHDMTADRGRRFDQYFLNDGVAWVRRSLIVGTFDVARMQRWLDQCYGVAFYAAHAAAFSLQPDAVVEWQVPVEPGSSTLKVLETRPAWVLRGIVNGAPVDLFIDKERSYLLQEVTPQGRRVFSDFRDFGGRVLPARINEFARSRQGETLTPIAWRSVKYDVPVEDWLFEEDKPVR
jgi:hypothetical protein